MNQKKIYLNLHSLYHSFRRFFRGPIGRYSNLAHQFYEEHSFDFMRIERGVQRVLWGFFKKMVIADTAAVFVDVIFDQYQTYNGLAIFGVLAYSGAALRRFLRWNGCCNWNCQYVWNRNGRKL